MADAIYIALALRSEEASVADHLEQVRAGPLRLSDGDSAEAAFLHIARNCLAQISGNERGVVDGANPESVHQMLVMREAISHDG